MPQERLGYGTTTCKICDSPGALPHTGLCDACWEVAHRLARFSKTEAGRAVLRTHLELSHLSLELDGHTVRCSNCGQDFALLYGIQQHIDAGQTPELWHDYGSFYFDCSCPECAQVLYLKIDITIQESEEPW